MKRTIVLNFLIGTFILGTAVAVSAQRLGPQNGQPGRPKMLQELGLTSDQLERLKRLQADLGQKNRVAQMRQREANKALDDAIYSDTATEEQIRELVRAAQEAANEAIRLRTLTELEMKKILTREQLIKFRELKKRFDRRQQMGPPPDGGRPPRRGQRPEN